MLVVESQNRHCQETSVVSEMAAEYVILHNYGHLQRTNLAGNRTRGIPIRVLPKALRPQPARPLRQLFPVPPDFEVLGSSMVNCAKRYLAGHAHHRTMVKLTTFVWGLPHFNQFRPHVKPLPSPRTKDRTDSGTPACPVDLTTNQAVGIQLLRSDPVPNHPWVWHIIIGNKKTSSVPRCAIGTRIAPTRQAMYTSILHHSSQAPRTNCLKTPPFRTFGDPQSCPLLAVALRPRRTACWFSTHQKETAILSINIS